MLTKKELVLIIGYILFAFFLAIVFVVGIGYPTACKEAKVINKHFGTQYTCSDMFWASNSIRAINYKACE